MSESIILRPYQDEKINAGLRDIKAGRDFLFEEPTGSGKTLQGVTLLRIAVGRTLSHAIIAAPQKQIEDGFLGQEDRLVCWPAGSSRSRPIKIPADFIRTARGSKATSTEAILSYLATANPGHVLACTHAAIRNAFKKLNRDRLPASLEGFGLFVDESHHSAADGLSSVVEEWSRRGGRLMYATATPYGRSDGRNPIRKGMVRHRRSQAEHMEEGYAPRELHNGIVTFGSSSDVVTAREFTGEAVTSNEEQQKDLARKMVAQWLEDGRPKVIVRVPPMVGGCRSLVKILIHQFSLANARILSLVGEGAKRQKECLDALNAEKGRSYGESRYDVMIGCMRVTEGTDWPVCSHVYCLGLSSSLAAVIQLIGRATRMKAEDHPSRDVTKIVFFVPGGDGDRLRDLDIQHSRHALLVCVYMADHEAGSRFALAKGLRTGMSGLGGDVIPQIDDALDMDPIIHAEAKLHMANLMQEKPGATPGDLIDAASRAMPDVPQENLNQIIVELISGDDGVAGSNVRETLAARIREQARIDPHVPSAMKAVFAAIVKEFRDEAIVGTADLRSLAKQIHRMTGGSMAGYAERLASYGGLLTEDMILEWVRQWKERTGIFPKASSGKIPGTNETWSAVSSCLESGLRGMVGGDSLPRLISRHFGQRYHRRKFSLATIRDWVMAWRDATGSFPTRDSGEIPNSEGETWGSINGAFYNNLHGISGYVSLADFLCKEFGCLRRAGSKLPSLSFSKIIEWLDAYFVKHGRFPTGKSTRIIPDSEGETWRSVNQAGQRGSRGLPRGSTLWRIIKKHFPDRPNAKSSARTKRCKDHCKAKTLRQAS